MATERSVQLDFVSFRYVNHASWFGQHRRAGLVDSNNKRTYHEFIEIKEAGMHPIAVHALRDIAEIAALGAFLIMIALIARAVGS
jgi:hypothetical protein